MQSRYRRQQLGQPITGDIAAGSLDVGASGIGIWNADGDMPIGSPRLIEMYAMVIGKLNFGF